MSINKIKVKRAKKNLSQQNLADAVNVSRQTIHAIETGKSSPSLDLAQKIAYELSSKTDKVFPPKNKKDETI